MYRIQYETTVGIEESFINADNEKEALDYLHEYLSEFNDELIRIFEVKLYKAKGVLITNSLF
jgi:ribulose bisphosphate carboxylase small subunit